MHYLDNAATTRVLPEAAEAAVHAMCEGFGNPSSLHKMGIEASHLLEDSRKTVASALGCLPEETYFTSCGTESTNISLRGAAHLNRHKKGRIITTEIEHAATLNTCKQLAAEGFDVVFLAPDETGHITPAALEEALTADTILLSCQLVNNEIGTVQPVAELGALLKAKAPGALFHIDAVQGLCRVPLTPKKWNCDRAQDRRAQGHRRAVCQKGPAPAAPDVRRRAGKGHAAGYRAAAEYRGIRQGVCDPYGAFRRGFCACCRTRGLSQRTGRGESAGRGVQR